MATSDSGVAGTVPVSWVTKANVTDYLRCPYAFWLLDRKEITRAETVTPFQQHLIDVGVAFEERVIEGARPVHIEAGAEQEFLRGQHRLVTTGRMFRNDTLRLRGSPDGIIAAGGSVEPFEIKSHRRISRSDLIELAFYWKLLEPLRTRSAGPAGWVFLRAADGSVAEQRVELPVEVFDHLYELIDGIRRARIEGVQPKYCRCPVCSGLRREHVRRHVTQTQDISAIWGVGRGYAPLIRSFGVEDWAQLIACDPLLLAHHMSEVGRTRVSPKMVIQWQAHAKALTSNQPTWVTDPAPFPLSDEYIALDLEYNAEAKDVWLIGARVVEANGHTAFSCWTDQEGNAAAFTALGDLLGRHPGIPIVTWNGLSADMPMLRTAASRCGMDSLANAVDSRHIDLYDWLRRHLMVPIMDFGLKEMSHWAGITRESSVLSGGGADNLHSRYLRTGDTGIRDQLLDYSRDDVDGLVQLIEFLRALVLDGQRPQVDSLPDAARVVDLVYEDPITPRPLQPRPLRPKPPWMAQETYDRISESRDRRSRPVPPRARL